MSFVRLMNRPQVLNFFDTPTFQRHTFGSLIVTNALLRPTATMLDKSASEKERRYSAARELFHQSMCFVSHYSLASNFEKLAFQIAKKFPKLQQEFGEFQTFQQVKDARLFNVEARKHNRLVAAQLKSGAQKTYKEIPRILRGVLRMGDSLGTILALTCVAPLVNNYLLSPTLQLLKQNSDAKKSSEAGGISKSFPSRPPFSNQFALNQFNVNAKSQPFASSTQAVSPFWSPAWGMPSTAVKQSNLK